MNFRMIAIVASMFVASVYAQSKAYPGDPRNQFCLEGEVWSVQVQCDSGTRSGIERIWPGGNSSLPGVESCAVTYQGCEPVVNPAGRELRRGREATDSGQPMVLIIFGVNRILDKPGL